MTARDDALDLLAGIWFHMRALWATPFFLQTALLTPFTFSMFRLIAARWQITPGLWFDASVSGLWATTTTAVGIIGYQRFQGVLQYQAMSVKPAWTVFLPPVAASALIGVAGVPVAWTTASLFAGRPIVPDATRIVGLTLAALSCVASAAALSALFVLSRRAIAFEPLVLTPVWLMSGIVLPVDRFPAAARAAAFIHPLTAAVWVAGCHRLDGPATAATLWCLLLCTALLGCAGVGLRHALGRATVDGTLDLA